MDTSALDLLMLFLQAAAAAHKQRGTAFPFCFCCWLLLLPLPLCSCRLLATAADCRLQTADEAPLANISRHSSHRDLKINTHTLAHSNCLRAKHNKTTPLVRMPCDDSHQIPTTNYLQQQYQDDDNRQQTHANSKKKISVSRRQLYSSSS